MGHYGCFQSSIHYTVVTSASATSATSATSASGVAFLWIFLWVCCDAMMMEEEGTP